MTSKLFQRLALAAISTAVVLAGGSAITRADPPGYLFMDIGDNHALVVQPPRDQALARISKQPAKLGDDIASVIASDGTPVGANGIILVYHGQLYILPDKDLGGGTMASHMVMRSASSATH